MSFQENNTNEFDEFDDFEEFELRAMAELKEIKDFYITLKNSYEVQPTPKLGKDLVTMRNTILANFGPEFLAEIDPDGVKELALNRMMDSLEGTKPN